MVGLSKQQTDLRQPELGKINRTHHDRQKPIHKIQRIHKAQPATVTRGHTETHYLLGKPKIGQKPISQTRVGCQIVAADVGKKDAAPVQIARPGLLSAVAVGGSDTSSQCADPSSVPRNRAVHPSRYERGMRVV